MRDKDTLKLMDNIAKLNQYLYMNEGNYIEYDNGVAILEIRMNEECDYISNYKSTCKAFENLRPLRITADMSIRVLENIIKQLKEQSPEMKNTNFKNRWEEILAITSANIAINFQKK